MKLSQDDAPPEQEQQIKALRAEVGKPKDQVAAMSYSDGTTSLQSVASPVIRPRCEPSSTGNCEVLTRDDLEFPVTAVHTAIHLSPGDESQKNESGCQAGRPSRWYYEEDHSQSIVERGVIDASQARGFLSESLHHYAVAIFDPVIDTYESVNELTREA